ncbi:uncharacterized protein JCM6883_006527 [Sporobolomyces salmoneus]|uniref:uncharacterized protein n=1 Tax=Sporobolomyces salmoneus TaxID=183962 RepID=UPI00317331D9
MLEVDVAIVKPWLIQHLEPITDAEPSTLAEYVLALLQRDETLEELERICIESLGDFLEGHTEKFVKELLAFVRSPRPVAAVSPPAPQRKRPLEAEGMDQSAAKRNSRQPQQPQGPNGGLAKGMCRDYHRKLSYALLATKSPAHDVACLVRGFCARGQACPYQHDAFATAQPPPGAFPPFQFPFGGPAPPQGGFPPGMGGPGMPPLRLGFPSQPNQNGMPPYGGGPNQPGFPSPQFGGPPQGFHQQRQQQQQPRHQNNARNTQPPPPFASSRAPFPSDPNQQNQPYPPFNPHQSPTNKRRPPPPPQSYERPHPSTRKSSTGPPPTPLTVLTHRFATNASKQKELLEKLDTCGSPEEKKEVMGELRKLNKEAEEIMGMKKKIEEQEKEKEEKAKEAAAKKAEQNQVAEGDKGDLKAQLEKLRSEAASLGIPTDGQSPAITKPFPSKRGPPRTAQSFRLDNRSTNVIIESLEDLGDPEEIKKHFEGFGPVKTFSIKEKEAGEMTEGGEILVGFESRAIAEKAMASGPPPSASLAKLRWAPSTSTPASSSAPAPAPTSTISTNGSTAASTQDVNMEYGGGDLPEPVRRASSVERSRDDDDDERSWNR